MGHGPKSWKATELNVPIQLLPTSHQTAQKCAENGKTGSSTRKRQGKAKISALFPLTVKDR